MPMSPCRRLIVAALILACPAPAAFAVGNCYFPKRPPATLKDMGPCRFDPETQTYAGEPAEQARCLLTPVLPVGHLGPPLIELPDALAHFVGTGRDLPSRAALRALLADRGLMETLGDTLSEAVAHAHDGDPLSRSATYFVLHDTSSPNFRGLPWPRAIDDDPKVNSLARYQCANRIERAHVFINRRGAILLAHDFIVPWRATKFETATNHGSALKGLYLHIELIQPRRALSGYGRRNDFLAPDPGFTQEQYDALALVYTIASVRAGFWMIPGYHAVIDEGIRDKHDDPQNFDLDAFAARLTALRAALAGGREATTGSN
ncbi:MAG: hypothetical protein F9K38_05175 [Pseudorhodoplanes sp.]|nr:MAG: hypothetical protein F9K38_05175 [Pseudorhodoplanes sp.]